MIKMDKSYETAIGKKICSILPVEWIRFNMFNLSNIYYNIPMLVFRLNYQDGNIEKLQKCLDTFEGNEKWNIFIDPFSRKGNHILSIEIVREIYQEGYRKGILYNEREYLGEKHYKLYCERAIQDIPLLLDYINNSFGGIS